jgi:hypothetical protein
MAALKRFVGERLNIDDAIYEIVGYDIANRDAVILATSLTPPYRRVELSPPQVLLKLFDEP